MIAIVIPYYKLQFLDKLLLSLKKQTNQNFNIYIGNDNSPENPLPVIEKYVNDLHITYKKFDNNIGGKSLTKQWERCLTLIKNEDWFMLPGDDDEFTPQVIEKFYENLNEVNQQNIGVVKYATRLIDANGNYISEIYKHPKIEKSTEAFFRKINGLSRSSVCEYVFKTAQYEKYKFKNYLLAWGSDDMAVMQFSDFGNILCVNDALMMPRISAINISGQKDINKYKKNFGKFVFHKDLVLYHSKHFKKQQNIKSFDIMVKNLLMGIKNFLVEKIIKN